MIDHQFSEVQEAHLPVLAEILNHYILNSTFTFHKDPLAAEEMREKVFFEKPYYTSLLISSGEDVIGYVALSPWKKQEAYRHTAEINIYLHPEHTQKGVGTKAIAKLEEVARNNDISVLIAGICSENTASIALFSKCGFQHCAHFKGVGMKFGRLLDTVYLQKQLP